MNMEVGWTRRPRLGRAKDVVRVVLKMTTSGGDDETIVGYRGRGDEDDERRACVVVVVVVVDVFTLLAVAAARDSMAMERCTCSIIARVCDAAVVAWASMAGSMGTPDAARACKAATAD